ncbi:hypothetical protein I7I48_10036 [Histoplasma ohiense]|nr:hypothetical protein I7I48_10036 [Histoplasma ohiense (nom. inval.)]
MNGKTTLPLGLRLNFACTLPPPLRPTNPHYLVLSFHLPYFPLYFLTPIPSNSETRICRMQIACMHARQVPIEIILPELTDCLEAYR